MTLVIRQAERADASFLAWVMLAATRAHALRGWFDVILDRPEEECLAFLRELAVTPTQSWWHYSRYLVAEKDGQPVAGLTAFRASDGYPLSGAALAEACAVFGWEKELPKMMERGSYIFTCTFSGGDDLWTTETVATLPAYRGQGISTALLRAALEQGRQKGFRQAQITVMIGNDSAERIYRKLGFTFEEKRSAAFEAATGVPGLRHGLCDLQNFTS